MLDAGLLKSKQSLTYAELQNSIAKSLSTQMSEAEANAKSVEIITSMGLNTSMTSEGIQTVKLTSKKLKEAVVSGKLSEQLATEIAMHNGVTFSMGKQATTTMPNWIASLKTSTRAIKEQTVATIKWLATNPVAWCVAAAGAILLINNSIQKSLKSLKQQKDLLEETKNHISNYDSESNDVKGKISSNKEKINELKNSDNLVDKNTVSALEEENAALTEQLQLLESLKEIEQEIAENTAMDILNNTAEITKLNKVFKDIKSFNFIDAIKDSNISVGAVLNSKDMWQEGDIWGGIKNLGKGAVNTFNPLSGLVDWLTPKKENDKSIIDETDDQIAKVSELREKLAKLESKRDSMSKNQYDKQHRKLTDNINEASGGLVSDIKELKTYQSTLDSTDPNQKAKIDEIQKVLDNYTKSMVKLEDYNTFDKIINSEIYGSSKNELIDLAVQGTLTEETLDKNYHNLYVLFDALGLKFDDITEKLKSMKGEAIPEDAFIPSTICSTIDEIKEQISSAFSALGSAYSEIFKIDSDTGNINFSLDNIDNNMLSNIKDSFSKLEGFDTSNLEAFFSVLTNGASTSEQVQEAFDNLAASYLYSSTTLDNLNDSTVDAVAKQLEELGIVNARQVAYDTLNAKKEALNIMTKNGAQSQDDFFAMSYEAQAQLLNEANASDICRAHIARLQAQTIDLNETGLSTADKIEKLKNLANAYGLAGTAAQTMLDDAHWASIAEQEKNGAVTGQHKDGPMGYTEYDYQKAYEDFIKQTDEQFNIKFNIDPNNSNDTQKNAIKEAENSKEVFDWIETRINRLKTVISELGETASNTFKSLAERLGAYGNEISKVTEEIQLQKDAYNKYMERANSVGLPEEWAAKVRDGSLDISEISDDTRKNKIKDYQSWYNKAQDCLNTVNDLEKELSQLNIDRLQLSIDKASRNLDKFKSSSDKIQDRIDNKNRKTKISDYDKLDESYRKQIAYYMEQNSLLREQQQYVDRDSEQWEELQSKIRENNIAANKLIQDIKENKNLRIQISIDVKAGELDSLKNTEDRINGIIDIKESSGEYAKFSDYKKLYSNIKGQINNIQSQNRLIKEQQKNVEKGSEAWIDFNNQMQSNNNTITSLIKSIADLAEKIAGLPLEKAERKLEKYSNSLEILQKKYEQSDNYKTRNKNLDKQTTLSKKEAAAYNKAEQESKNYTDSLWESPALKSALRSKSNKGKKEGDLLSTKGLKVGSQAYEAVIKYNAAIKKQKEIAHKAEIATLEYTKTLKDNTKAKYDNIAAYFDSKRKSASADTSKANAYLDFRSATGKSNVSSAQKDALKSIKSSEKNELNILKQERKNYSVSEIEKQYKNGKLSFDDYKNQIAYVKNLDAEILNLESDIAKTQKTIDEIRLTKLGYEIDRLNAKSTKLSNNLSLKQKKGDKIQKSDYTRQIRNNNDTYSKLEQQNKELIKLRNGVTKYSDDWIKYQEQIDSNTNTMNGLLETNEDLKDSLREDIYWKPFDKMQNSIESTKNSLSSLIGLIDDDSMFDKDGKFTDMGTAKYGLIIQGLNASKKDITAYEDRIKQADKLWQEYLNGADNGYSEDEYLQDIEEFTKGLQGAFTDAKSYTDQIIDVFKNQQQAVINALNEEISARSDALKKKKEYYDYDKSIRSKTKDIQSLETQIAAIQATEDSLEKRKKLLELQEELQNAKDDLEDTQKEHEINLVINGLEDFSTEIQDTFDESIQELKTNFEKQADIINQANIMYQENFAKIGDTLKNLIKFYGGSSESIMASSAGYSKLLSDKTSNDKKAKDDYDNDVNTINKDFDDRLKDAKDSYDKEYSIRQSLLSYHHRQVQDYDSKIDKTEDDISRLQELLKNPLINETSKNSINNQIHTLYKKVDSLRNSRNDAINKYNSILSEINELTDQYNNEVTGIERRRTETLKKSEIKYNQVLKQNQDEFEKGLSLLSFTGINPNAAILNEKFTELIPNAVDIMDKFVNPDLNIPDFPHNINTTPPLPNINVEFNVEGDVNQDTWKEIKNELPKISKYVQQDIYHDLKQSGALKH